MPNKNRRSIVAPLPSGVPSVTAPALKLELKPPPFDCAGGVSRVVPCTVGLVKPVPHGGRSTLTTTSGDVRGRRSEYPNGAGNVVRSMIRKRSRVMLAPVLLVIVRR